MMACLSEAPGELQQDRITTCSGATADADSTPVWPDLFGGSAPVPREHGIELAGTHQLEVSNHCQPRENQEYARAHCDQAGIGGRRRSIVVITLRARQYEQQERDDPENARAKRRHFRPGQRGAHTGEEQQGEQPLGALIDIMHAQGHQPQRHP